MAQNPQSPVRSDRGILAGTPVFAGTRVPVQTLFDCLAAGDRLGEFLADFPTVTRVQAVAVLRRAGAAIVAEASPPR